MADDPHAIFDAWLKEAEASEPNDPNAVALATVNADARPSLRMVLCKGHDADGFVFYTNRESRKAAELALNAQVALLFHWKSLRRQVRVEGKAVPVSDAESDAYFASRSRASQIGAWASDQSRPLDARETFERRYAEIEQRFAGQDVPRPPHWGGYRVVPDAIELWEDRPGRLHHRRIFRRENSGWTEGLLYP